MPNMSEETVEDSASRNQAVGDPIARAVERVAQDRAAQIGGERAGRPSIFTCPDCGGTLWQVAEPELLQFRCHVGHILTGQALLAQQASAAENSLWYTIRTLTDSMVLARELAEAARRNGDAGDAAELEGRSDDAERRARALREIAEGGRPG